MGTNIPSEKLTVEGNISASGDLQLVNNGFIDPSLTCDMKVRFLKSNNENYLANLYKGYCDTQFKGKVLVLNWYAQGKY